MIHFNMVSHPVEPFEEAVQILQSGWESGPANHPSDKRREDNPYTLIDKHKAALWDSGFRWSQAARREG